MARGEWDSLAGLVVAPALEEAAAELSARPGIVAAAAEHPISDGWLLWVARSEPGSAFVAPHGSFAILDEPVLPMVRVEEADSSVAGGRPIVRLYLRHSELSIAAIKAMAIAFAERLPTIECHPIGDCSAPLSAERAGEKLAAPR